MGGEDIVRFIKAQRKQWLGHVERMDESAIPKKMLKGKLYATRRIRRPRIRLLEDVITDLRRMGISGWMEKARNRDEWRRISGDWSLRRPRITQDCNVGKKKKKNILYFLYLYETN